MDCNCDEKFKVVGNKRTRLPDGEWAHFHDCSYVAKRMLLAKKAEANVIERHGCNLPGPRFTRLFANEMEKLVREEKLI